MFDEINLQYHLLYGQAVLMDRDGWQNGSARVGNTVAEETKAKLHLS